MFNSAKRQPTLNQTKAACNCSTGSPLCLLIYKEPSYWNKHLIHQAWKHLNFCVLVTFQWPCQWIGRTPLLAPISPSVHVGGRAINFIVEFLNSACQLHRNFDDCTHLPLFYLFFSFLLWLLCTQELGRKVKQLFLWKLNTSHCTGQTNTGKIAAFQHNARIKAVLCFSR